MSRWSRAAYLVLAAAGGFSLVASMMLPSTFITTYGTLLSFYVLVALPLYAAGLFAYLKAPDHPTARRLLTFGALFSISDFFEVILGRAYVSRGPFAGMWAVNLAYQATGVLATIYSVRLFALFPDGRSRVRYERVVLGALWAYIVVPLLLLVARPTLALPGEVFRALRGPTRVPSVASPLHIALLAPLRGPLLALVDLQPLFFVLAFVLLALRFRTASPEQRIQIKWVLYTVALMTTAQLAVTLVRASGLVTGRAGDVLQNLVAAPIALVILGSFLIALFRYRLLDIDLVIRRSLVYGALWLLIGAAYVGVATGLGLAAGNRLPVSAAIVVTVAATLLFQPLHRRMERLAGRVVFGDRLSSYDLLTRFGETLEHAFDAGQLAPRIATAVREGLGVRWSRVSLQLGGELVQPAGAAGIRLEDEATPEVAVPLIHGGEQLGVIECGPKDEGRIKEEDLELLGTIARQAALGIHNGRLAAELSARLDEIRRQAGELAESRKRIVQAQDSERRRIERNIHDGVQQELVALVANLRLARNQLRRDPGIADATLADLQHEARQTLEDLRELSRGIHPAVLSDRGLLEAIETRASRLPIGVTIDADPGMRLVRFSDEIEGAAYFLVSEALANVMKHSGATRAAVHLWEDDDRLLVEVTDNGSGFAPDEAVGSGLTGLRDRIEAVGGSFRIESRAGTGTRVGASLPLRAREPSGV